MNNRRSIFIRRILLFTLLPVLFLFVSSTVASAANLRIVTSTINDNGGNWNPSDLSINVKRFGSDISGSPLPGSKDPGNFFTLDAGTYTISSGPYEKYFTSLGGDCDSDGNVTLLASDEKTCLITGNDRPARLILITQVTNDNGGKLTPSDFSNRVTIGEADVAGSPTPSSDSPGTIFSLSMGTFNVSVENTRSYTLSFQGDCDSSGNVTTTVGDKTCLINLNDPDVLVPGLPEAGGSDGANKQVCIDTNIFPWIISGLFLFVIFYNLFKDRLPQIKIIKK